jgi:hypothetical protein
VADREVKGCASVDDLSQHSVERKMIKVVRLPLRFIGSSSNKRRKLLGSEL